nr:hypothetical protein CFP56_69049 [Quercus suber]
MSTRPCVRVVCVVSVVCDKAESEAGPSKHDHRMSFPTGYSIHNGAVDKYLRFMKVGQAAVSGADVSPSPVSLTVTPEGRSEGCYSCGVPVRSHSHKAKLRTVPPRQNVLDRDVGKCVPNDLRWST